MTKILLVEDDKSLREIYGVRLLAEGYQIVSAGDGEEALAMAVKEHPNLIISDVMMPKISGFDMLDILRSTPETKDVKVIMMTALSSEDQRTRGESLGANRYLVKSQVGIEDVVRTVHDVLADSPIPVAPTINNFGTPTLSARQTVQPVVVPRPFILPTQPSVGPPAEQLAPIPAPIPTPNPVPVVQTIPAFTPTPSMPNQNPIVQPIPAVAPAYVPTSQANPTQLPQPTAPFTSPAPASLGNQTINPIQPTSSAPDIASLIAQELNNPSITTPGAA